jgi:hypothetical protein
VYLAGKEFVTDADVNQAVTSTPQTLDTDFFNAGINFMVSGWDKYLHVCDGYVEV